jgi:hypothetical protein
MPGRLSTQSGAMRNRTDHVALERHRYRRRRRARKLRIEMTGNPIRTLRRERRAGIEQPEIARIRHLHNSVLQMLDRPVQ